jgi:hypothetical protein
VKDNPSLFYHHIGKIYHRSFEIGRNKLDDGAESAGNPSGDSMTYKKKLIEVALPLDAINKASAREKSIRQGHPSTLHLWWARRPLAAARAVIFSQMVDDPSGYTETLLSDSNKKRAATRELGKRKNAWDERKDRYEEARRQGNQSVPDPGPEPTLQGCVADIERERLFRIIEDLVLWENTTNETVLQQARDEIWQSWRRACAENADHPRARELFDRFKLPAFHDPFAGGGALPSLDPHWYGVVKMNKAGPYCSSGVRPNDEIVDRRLFYVYSYFSKCSQ